MSRRGQAALVALAFLALAFSATLALGPLSDESINDLNVYRNIAVKVRRRPAALPRRAVRVPAAGGAGGRAAGAARD